MVIILQGSNKDKEWSNKIVEFLGKLSIKSKIYTASAHKTPEFLLELLKKNEIKKEPIVYICVAGRSNALGGFVDANTKFSVINCPPYSDKYQGLDIFSSLRMPTGVAALTVLEPDAAALGAAKILAYGTAKLNTNIKKYQKNLKEEIINSNE